MANRITISNDDAIICRVLIESNIRDLRKMPTIEDDPGMAQWLDELTQVYDRLTIKLFGRAYLEREKAKAAV